MFLAQLVIRVVESLTDVEREPTQRSFCCNNCKIFKTATCLNPRQSFAKKKSAKFAAFLLPLTSDQPTVAKFNCFLLIRAGINLLELTN